MYQTAIKYSVLILFLFSLLTVQAQTTNFYFENFSTKNGVPHVSFNHILEDHLGFLWFATNSGLYRYDGYSLKAYRHDVHDTTSVSSPGVHFVSEDRFGRIWVSTMYGINLLDRRTGTFSRYLPHPSEVGFKGKNIIRDLLVDQDNRLFVLGNKNLYLFDENTKGFKLINQADHPTKQYRVNAMIELKNGTIWCAADKGLLKILPGDTLFSFIQPDTIIESGYNEDVKVIAAASNNKIWIYTSAGFGLFDPFSGYLKKDILPIDFRTQRITTIKQINDGSLLIGFANNGLGVFRSENDFQHYDHSDEKINSLHHNMVTCILQDQFGNIWLGTAAGVSKITAERSGFKLLQNKSGLDQRANNVTNIHKDREETIWMNTELGIYAKSAKAEFGEPVHISSEIKQPATTNFIYEDSKGNIWIPVKRHGIWKKEKSSPTFNKVKLNDALDKTVVHKIFEDQKTKHILWIGTHIGLCKLNTITLQYQLYKPLDQLDEVKTNRMIVFAEYGEEIWLYYTYYNSIGRFDKRTEKFELIRPPAEKQYMLEGVFRDMAVSDDGKVWIATNFGLTQYNIKQHTFDIYTKKEGLPDNDLNAVVIDHNNQTWISGQQFVGKWNKETNTFMTFDVADKVKKLWGRSAHVFEDGQLLFGSLNGILTFHPDSIKTDPVSPKIVLTNFKVNDSTFLLEDAFEYTENIVLSHKQNDLSFEFSGIHYIDPNAIKYQCLLEGYDQHWRNLGHDHYASYTNLNPGEFTFRVKTANKDGLWSKQQLAINVLITPPFTQTNWFRAMIAFFLGSIIYVVFKNRQHQLALKTEKELAEKSAAYKTRFLADVSHEIRTPMNAIIGLSKLTLDTKLDSQQSKFVSAIQDSSKNLLTIINDLLDHTKLEAGKFTFTKKPFELQDIIRQLGNTFNYAATEKQLDFQIVVKHKIPKKIKGDPTRLNQILTNLLGNAVKFTDKGKVWLHVEKQQETNQNIRLRFEVGDTGIGIPKNEIDSIFESFSQVNAGINKGMEGTGLGLSIARQLVEKQGGQLFIESELNKGTRLWFELAFEKTNVEVKNQDYKKREFIIDQLKVMVVEDTYFNQMLVVEILKKHIKKVEIVIAENGKVALDKLTQHYFDIILMDAKMPVMDGYEATKLIRQLNDETLRNIPILAVTASAIPEQLQKCRAAGMNDFVTKPIDENELLEKMFLLTQNGSDD